MSETKRAKVSRPEKLRVEAGFGEESASRHPTANCGRVEGCLSGMLKVFVHFI